MRVNEENFVTGNAEDIEPSYVEEMIKVHNSDEETHLDIREKLDGVCTKEEVDKKIGNIQIDVDDVMSDTSENAVQNKVIKAYVDSNYAVKNHNHDAIYATPKFVEEKISEFEDALSKDLVNILTNYITIEQMAEALDTKPSYNDVKIYIDKAILGGAW